MQVPYCKQPETAEICQWLLEQGFPTTKISITVAAERRAWGVVIWLVEQGASLTEELCESSAAQGNFSMLLWLRQHQCPWDCKTTTAAYNKKHLNIFEWARSEGCPVEEHITCEYVLSLLYLEVVEFEKRGGVWAVEDANNEQKRYLNWAKNFGIPLKFRDWNFILWLVTKVGAPWNDVTCSYLMREHDLSTVILARSLGCPLGYNVIENSLMSQNPALLDWVIKEEWKWVVHDIVAAANVEHYQLMETLHEQGCPIGQLWRVAAKKQSAKLLFWLREKAPDKQYPLLQIIR